MQIVRTLTKPYKRNLTDEDIVEAAKIVDSLTRDINPNQRAALVSFVLTTHRGTLARSNLLKLANDRFVFAAASEFMRFTRKNGKANRTLKRLRTKQKALFLMPVLVAHNKEVKNVR